VALSDVWRALETLKESLSWGSVDVSYYLVLSGMIMLIFTVSIITGLVVYKLVNNAASSDTVGFIKTIVIVSLAVFVLGLLLP